MWTLVLEGLKRPRVDTRVDRLREVSRGLVKTGGGGGKVGSAFSLSNALRAKSSMVTADTVYPLLLKASVYILISSDIRCTSAMTSKEPLEDMFKNSIKSITNNINELYKISISNHLSTQVSIVWKQSTSDTNRTELDVSQAKFAQE